MSKKFAPLLIAVIAVFFTFLPQAHGQNRITYGQVISSLDQSGGTARKVGVNVDALRADIAAHITAEGTENAKSAPDVLSALKQLPNFIVQVQFDLNADTIRPESWEIVGRIGDAFHHPLMSGNRYLIVGHTDAKGSRTYNLDLSERRAAAVVDMLSSVFKVDRSHLLSIGFGEEQLFDPANPDANINRRVEIINLGPA